MNIMGYIFSGYCVYKIVMALVNIIFDRNVSVDPGILLSISFDFEIVSRGFEILLNYFYINIDVPFWSQVC